MITGYDLAKYCKKNCKDYRNNFYEDDFRAWDIPELCLSYFLNCKPLFYQEALHSRRCPICKHYVKYDDNCCYCQKGVDT